MSSTVNGLTFTARIARWNAVHRWWVLAASVLVIVLAVLSIMYVGANTRNDASGVGESGQGSELLNERFNSAQSEPQTARRIRHEGVIFSNTSLDVNDPLFEDTVNKTIQSIRDLPHVSGAVSYYDTRDATMLAGDENAVLAAITLENPEEIGGHIELEPFLDMVRQASDDAAGFEIGVYSFRLLQDELDEILEEDFSRILLYSMVIGLIILIIAFRALVAAVIPLIMAIGSIFTAIGIAALISQVYPPGRTVCGNDPADGSGRGYRLFIVHHQPLPDGTHSGTRENGGHHGGGQYHGAGSFLRRSDGNFVTGRADPHQGFHIHIHGVGRHYRGFRGDNCIPNSAAGLASFDR